MEMKLLLAKFFQHYSMELHPSESFLIGQQLTCKPMSELKCRVSKVINRCVANQFEEEQMFKALQTCKEETTPQLLQHKPANTT
ncbi:hypothetical protein EB796_010325 [Bugula neritina]|uniref:Uncharacterized protein n=1 Tax=Bugula neritina TaxID=10212 RepID=A0A7J7JZG7_BUGNE|nr:hypothetical protein EB796_010325 [Bugula neritina]